MWMSDARSFTAWVISRLTSLMIGASSRSCGRRDGFEGPVFGFPLGRRFFRQRLCGAIDAVVACDGGENIGFRSNDRLHVMLRQSADVVDGNDVRGIGHRDDQSLLIVEADGHAAVSTGGCLRNHHDRRRVDVCFVQIDEFEAELLGQDRDQGALRDETELDHDAADRTTSFRSLVTGLGELFFSDQTAR